MSFLTELAPDKSLSAGLKYGDGTKASYILLSSYKEEDFEALQKIEQASVAVFIPIDWLLTRERMDQDWTINLPKGKGQETLYSTSFFWNPVADGVDQILQFAQQKGWAVYTQLEEKLCMLIVNSRAGVDIDAEALKGQFL